MHNYLLGPRLKEGVHTQTQGRVGRPRQPGPLSADWFSLTLGSEAAQQESGPRQSPREAGTREAEPGLEQLSPVREALTWREAAGLGRGQALGLSRSWDEDHTDLGPNPVFQVVQTLSGESGDVFRE